jgi:hypothetical protein
MMAGTIPLSMTQQFDEYGEPLSGGQLYIIQAGTVSTPQNAYQDLGLTIAMPYPMTLDRAGRVPQFFLADGSVKVRLQDRAGVVQLAADSVLVIGPSTGGGSGSMVDPTQLIRTGDMIFRYGYGLLNGCVRLNGLTIGPATSGATERPNADTQALFLHLWLSDPNLAVSGGRGASGAADWAANKQLALPDFRAYALGAMDGMGNTITNRLGNLLFANAASLGATGGTHSVTLTTFNLPPYTPSGGINEGAVAISHNAPATAPQPGTGSGVDGPYQWPIANSTATITATQSGTTFAGYPQGGTSTAFLSMGPRKLITFYIKL